MTALIDYDAGNMRSVEKALRAATRPQNRTVKAAPADRAVPAAAPADREAAHQSRRAMKRS